MMFLGFLIVAVSVGVALLAPFLGAFLLAAAIFRTHRARALYALRESLVLATAVTVVFVVFGWATRLYNGSDLLTLLTVFGMLFTGSAIRFCLNGLSSRPNVEQVEKN